MIYTEKDLNEALGKLALLRPHMATHISYAEAQCLITEIAALRQACDCYDGSKGIALAKGVAAREARERNDQGDSR